MLHIPDVQSQEASLKGLKRRSKIIMVFLFIISLASVIQIINLTVIDQENYVTESEKNRIVRIPVYPSRGLIALSNDNSVIVENIVSQKLTISLNSTEDVVSTISDIQKSIGISQEVIQSFFNVTSSSSRNINLTLIDDMTEEQVAKYLLHKERWPSVNIDAYLVYPEGEDGRKFLVYENFKTIMKWNRSLFFGISVGILSDMIEYY